MKIKLLLAVVFAATTVAASNSALASWNEQPLSLLGDPAPAQGYANEVVEVTNQTHHVNVTGGSTVRFVVDGHAFSWTFDNSGHVFPFDLERIAPKGLLHHEVDVYVSDNPLYEN